MTNHPNHRSNQIETIPGRGKNVHASKFNNAVDASFPSYQRKLFLFLRIGYAQTESLYVSIKPGNWVKQIVHLQNR